MLPGTAQHIRVAEDSVVAALSCFPEAQSVVELGRRVLMSCAEQSHDVEREKRKVEELTAASSVGVCDASSGCGPAVTDSRDQSSLESPSGLVTAKLVMLGDSNSGKSSLVQALTKASKGELNSDCGGFAIPGRGKHALDRTVEQLIPATISPRMPTQHRLQKRMES